MQFLRIPRDRLKERMGKTSQNILLKTPEEVRRMAEGGRRLEEVKAHLMEAVDVGVSAAKIEDLACELIEKTGGAPSFKMVPRYSWATCINVNEGVVHGIPKAEIVFKEGDVASVDVGMFYEGFHTDTSFSLGLNVTDELDKFLKTGREALRAAIDQVRPGKRIYDISNAIEVVVARNSFSPIKALVGHGIGRSLHEEPQIPCFADGTRQDTPEISEGAVLAIEVMYCQGSEEVVTGEDGWTIETADGKIAALFEETVAATKKGPLVLTRSPKS